MNKEVIIDIRPPSNARGWHVVKLDDDAYDIVKRERERLKKTRHASFSDAIRELKRKDKKI
jgi:predicted CopG family antitoxin